MRKLKQRDEDLRVTRPWHRFRISWPVNMSTMKTLKAKNRMI